MARLPRLAAPGHVHHVLQRGNNRQPLFIDAQDCEAYQHALGVLLAVHGVALHAYVLMPNHVHLLVTPAERHSLSGLMQGLGRRYSGWFNPRHNRSGALFEGRFRSTVIESEHYLLPCVRYVEMNPLRAGLVPDLSAYRWSSYPHHVGLGSDPLITEHPLVWALGNTPFERQAAYRAYVDQGAPAQELEAIRAAVHQGWALGSPAFLAELAETTRRRTSPRRPGRPKKQSVPNNLG